MGCRGLPPVGYSMLVHGACVVRCALCVVRGAWCVVRGGSCFVSGESKREFVFVIRDCFWIGCSHPRVSDDQQTRITNGDELWQLFCCAVLWCFALLRYDIPKHRRDHAVPYHAMPCGALVGSLSSIVKYCDS